MTAPGLNLDFKEGESFRRRSAPIPGLLVAVQKSIRDRPPLQGLQARDLEFGGRCFGVVLDREGQRVRLMHIFQLPDEDALYSQKLAELKRRGRKELS